MAAAPEPYYMSVEAYLELDRSTPDAKYEYYDGVVRLMAGGTPQHSLISINVSTALSVALRGSACRAFNSDARVQVALARYVYPDVTVSCSPEDVRDPSAIRSPRVVFEILSPSTEKFDRNEKANAYRACASIEAYVLIDPQKLSVEVYQRTDVFWNHFLYNIPEAIVDLTALSIQIPISEMYRDIEFPPEPPRTALPGE